MDILTEIIATKRKRVAAAKEVFPLKLLQEEALVVRREAAPHSLIGALNGTLGLNIIAEFKRRSPSKGFIREGADPAERAREYERGGAAAISVLTEEDCFAGSLDDLRIVRRTTRLPLLRKDFIVDEYQVYEAAAAGADALLLIAAALSDEQLTLLRKTTEDELNMDALVEVHTRDELQRAIAAGARLIGVNNRDLRTFSVSLETSVELADNAPPELLLVSESGLNTAADLRRLAGHGFKGFLIGETLMRAAKPAEVLRSLLEEAM